MRTEVVDLRRATPRFGSLDRDVYVGRTGHGYDGYFGNPIEVGRLCLECRGVHARGGDTLGCYEIRLDRRLVQDVEFRSRVRDLHRRRLGCFCAPRPCHGQLLARRAEQLTAARWTIACACARGLHTQCAPCYSGVARRCECWPCRLRRVEFGVVLRAR